jgi:TRAP-type mannitol/chloroaromatic compound transport system permease large subunit
MGWIAMVMFGTVVLVLLAGFPVAFTLSGTALAFAVGGLFAGVFDLGYLEAIPSRVFGVMSNQTLVAVPLFVFMGVMLERSRLAENLLDTLSEVFGRVRGGLAIAVTLVGMLLAASTGIVGATVVTMGLLSLPTMLKRGYNPAVSSGTICAAGTLGQIIPPSIILVMLGDVLSSAYQQAQLRQGIYSPETVSVGELFAGALLPGLLLVCLYLAWLALLAVLRPKWLPPHVSDSDPGIASLGSRVLRALLPPLFLILAVLGSIFSLVFRGYGGDDLVRHLLSSLPGGVFGAVLVVMLVMFLLGFVLDFIEITFVVVPIVGPVLLAMDLDPVWLGVMIAINLQTSFLTPPFGFSLFYLRGVAPAEVSTQDIYRGVVPFVAIQLLALALLAAWPSLATWLPDYLY